jgi:tetratricopeptide (TPR) repeat protein
LSFFVLIMVKTLPLASGTLASDAASVVSVQSGSREVTREDFFSTLRRQSQRKGGGGGGGFEEEEYEEGDVDEHSGIGTKSCIGSPLRASSRHGNSSKGLGLSQLLFRKPQGGGGGGGGGGHRTDHQPLHRPERRGRRQRASRHARILHDDSRSVVSNYEYGTPTTGGEAFGYTAASSKSTVGRAPSKHPFSAHPMQRDVSASSASSVMSCNVTIASHDTVKASNKTGWTFGSFSTSGAAGAGADAASTPSPTKILKRWNKLRGLLGGAGGKDGGGASGGGGGAPTTSSSSSAAVTKLFSVSEEGPPPTHSRRRSSSSSSIGSRSRCNSDEGRSNVQASAARARARSTPQLQTSEQTKLDQSIRGRLDGLAVLSLGPAHRSTLDPDRDYDDENTSSSNVARSHHGGIEAASSSNAQQHVCRPEALLPFETLPPYAFIGCSLYLSPRDVVRRMLWNSGHHPEIVLEGIYPGDDRWSVRIEQLGSAVDRSAGATTSGSNSTSKANRNTSTSKFLQHLRSIPIDPSLLSSEAFSPSITPVLTEEDNISEDDVGVAAGGDGGAPAVPYYQLWPTLWGTLDPAPDRADVDRMADEDPLLHLAAEHSIPIDLDEHTFCISERSHLDVVHSFVAASLGVGRLDIAITILSKLLKGLDHVTDENMRFVRGATLHNLGVAHMWQAGYDVALEQFHLAVQERTRMLPKDHPDVRVSQVWKGLAQFALGRYEDALFCLELALDMTPEGDIAKSKLLNNMGVVCYQKRQYMLALQKFTLSLELQRGWLDGSVRRDSIVHEASITLSNMGKLYLERGDCDLAYFVYEEALLLQTTIFPKDHELVLESLVSLALTRARENQPQKALQILQGCLRSQNVRYGKDSIETIDTLGYLGYLYEHLDCHEDALKCLAAVKKWQKLNLPPGHPALRKSREAVKRLEDAIGKKVSVWI